MTVDKVGMGRLAVHLLANRVEHPDSSPVQAVVIYDGRVTVDVGNPHTTTIVGSGLPNIPWEERPEGSSEVMWRSARNPVIPRDLLLLPGTIGSNSRRLGRFAEAQSVV